MIECGLTAPFPLPRFLGAVLHALEFPLMELTSFFISSCLFGSGLSALLVLNALFKYSGLQALAVDVLSFPALSLGTLWRSSFRLALFLSTGFASLVGLIKA